MEKVVSLQPIDTDPPIFDGLSLELTFRVVEHRAEQLVTGPLISDKIRYHRAGNLFPSARFIKPVGGKEAEPTFISLLAECFHGFF